MVSFRSGSGVTYASRTTTTFTAPTGIANDDILACTFHYGGFSTPAAPTPPSGFSLFGSLFTFSDGGGWKIDEYFYWKRASGESGNYSFTHSTANSYGYMAAYSGCLTSGTPFGAESTNSASSGSSGVGTGITTTAANSFLLFLEANPTGSGALSPPSGMTERYDSDNYWADELIAAAGATGNRTQTNHGGGWGVRMIELLNASGGGSPTDDRAATQSGAIAAVTRRRRFISKPVERRSAGGIILPPALIGSIQAERSLVL